jgi:hypothetical protein
MSEIAIRPIGSRGRSLLINLSFSLLTESRTAALNSGSADLCFTPALNSTVPYLPASMSQPEKPGLGELRPKGNRWPLQL